MTNIHAQRLKAIQDGGVLRREATFKRAAFDADARTVELSFSSETDTVERWFGIEVLGHDAGEVDLSRLNNGAPVLWLHDWADQRGVVESARIDADRVGRAVIRFSRSPAGDQLLQDVRDGIVTKVSVGYTVNGLQLVEERGEVAVYRVTSWTPHEISMVSVPADDTVGVGRSASIKTRSALAGHSTSKETAPTMSIADTNRTDAAASLARQIAGTRAAPGDIIHYNSDNTVRGVTSRTAAVVDVIDVRSELQPAADPRRLIAALPGGPDAGQVTRLDTSIVAASAVLSSGANLVVCDLAEENAPLALGNGEIGWERRERRFDTIDRAPFTFIDGEDEELVPHSARITSRLIDTTGMKLVGTRVELTRQEQRMFASEGVMAAEVLTSFALGLGAALDRLYLDALLVSLPPAYSLAAVAAAGYGVGALRAIVGSAAAGAVVEPITSELRVSGLPARMTAAMAETLVLIPARSAIAIDSDIRIIAQRIGKNGGLALTALASAIPLVDAGSAWAVA